MGGNIIAKVLVGMISMRFCPMLQKLCMLRVTNNGMFFLLIGYTILKLGGDFLKLTICELSYLNELITSCVNTITCMSLFKNQVTDEELKSILTTHFPIHVEDYNRKVEFVKDACSASGKLNVPELNTSIFSENINASKPATPITVNTNVTKLTDREIALSYFLTLKRAGKEYAIASMEATDPKLRQFLKDAYTMSCNHSYEVYEWLAKNNFYPITVATGEQTGNIGSIYNPIPIGN